MSKIAVFIAFAMTVYSADASACSWFSPCKPVIHHVKKAKPNPAIAKHEAALVAHEQRFIEHDRKLEGYRATIVTLSIAITKLNARIAQLEKPH